MLMDVALLVVGFFSNAFGIRSDSADFISGVGSMPLAFCKICKRSVLALTSSATGTPHMMTPESFTKTDFSRMVVVQICTTSIIKVVQQDSCHVDVYFPVFFGYGSLEQSRRTVARQDSCDVGV